MGNMRIAYDNLIDYSNVVITSGSEDADLPDDNVQHPHRSKPYRTGTASAAEWIKFDFVTAKAVQCVVLLDHTLTSGDSAIALQGNASDSWGSPSVNESLTYNADVIAKFLSSAQTYRYWRVVFTKSAAAQTRDIGRIFIGPFYECVKNISFGGLTITPVDLSETGRSIGGQSYSDQRDIYHEVKASFNYIADAQMTQFKTLAATVGTHTPFFISCDPTVKPYDWLFYVKFQRFVGRKVEMYRSTSPEWSVDLEFAEEL